MYYRKGIRRLSRREAKQILNCMRDILTNYGVVTLGDYYDLKDTIVKCTDDKVGWLSLDKAKVKWSFQHG